MSMASKTLNANMTVSSKCSLEAGGAAALKKYPSCFCEFKKATVKCKLKWTNTRRHTPAPPVILHFPSSQPLHPRSGWSRSVAGSGFGLQQFKEQFVHGHAAVLLDAAEVLDGASGRLTEEGEVHDQFAGTPRVLRVVGGLVILEGPVKDVLESLNCRRVLDLHGV